MGYCCRFACERARGVFIPPPRPFLVLLSLLCPEVEDWTGLGLPHLSARLVATPLAACVTLLDDPLRLLRAVRFATR